MMRLLFFIYNHRIKFVEFGEDYKVKIVDTGGNLKVKYATMSTKSGQWQLVDIN